MKKISKENLVLILILLAAFFFRVFLIDRVPPSLSNDEVDYIYDAWSISKTGKDVLGKKMPLSFVTDQKMSPVPVYITALFFLILPLNIFVSRLPFALGGVVVVYLTFLLAKKFFNKKIALISSLFMAISPWHLQISRVAYDANFALLFYLLAIFLFFERRLLLSFLSFILGYYSYHGTKIIFLPLVFFLVVNQKEWFKKRKKTLFIFLTGIFLVFISFYFVGKNERGLERINEILFLEKKEASEFVNQERRTSLAPLWLKKIFNNKPLYYLRIIKERYFAYLNFLFNNGEESGLYSLWFRGNMYFIDLFFILIAVFGLFNKKRQTAIFFIIMIFISVFPSALSAGKSSFGTRALISLPFLIILVAYGFSSFLKKRENEKFDNLKIIVVIFLYCWSFLSYLYQYYFRYPLYGAENWYFGDQQAINLLIEKERQGKKIIFTHYHFPILMRYAFTAQKSPSLIQKIAKTEGDILVDNLNFLRGCPQQGKGSPYDFMPSNSVLFTQWDWDCYKEYKADREIRAKSDGRILWRIFEKE